jgi:predicted DNA-binding transcriptional regulator AlpA
MALPVLLTPDAVCEYFDISRDTLDRWNREGYGPVPIKVGQKTVYPETAVEAFVTAQMTGSKAATPAALQAALQAGRAGVREMQREKVAAMQQLDREDRESLEGVTPLTVGVVGATPGEQIERHFNIPPQPVEQPAPPHLLNCR